MQQVHDEIIIHTDGSGLYEFTAAVERKFELHSMGSGLVTLFCRHTSCSLLAQENADPSVQSDLAAFFRRLVPEGMDWITHKSEGPDDMPAHIKTALTQTSLSIPVVNGQMVLGTWQGLYLFEHRKSPHIRRIAMHLLGEVRLASAQNSD